MEALVITAVVVVLVAAGLLQRANKNREWHDASLALGLLSLATALTLASFNDRQPDDPVGLLQRVLLLSVGAWFVLATLEVRRVRTE